MSDGYKRALPEGKYLKKEEHMTQNKTIVISTLLAAMMVIVGIAVADPNPKNSEPQPDVEHGSAIISNGLIQLGVNDTGNLDIPGGTPSSGSGTTFVGLRFLPTNAEALAPGCLCEGWGAADNITGTTGFANQAFGGAFNMDIVSFTNTTTDATSIVDIPNNTAPRLRVKHFYHPSVSPNLYQGDVSITNMGSTAVELLYRRVMDWDVEPTFFNEFVTVNNGSVVSLVFTSNNGFASANPLSGPSSLGFTGSFVDAGPFDHGALFDFNFGTLAPGATKEFRIFYGAAKNETEANASLLAVGAEAFSFGQPNTPGGPTLGTPNTFIFAFASAPIAAKGNITGGGSIISPVTPAPKNNNKATFGFVAHFADGAATPSGNLQYSDKAAGLTVHGNVTTLNVNKATNTATFSGTAKVNGVGGFAYTVTAVDNGEPGKTDTFAISIPAIPYTASGTLVGGNIQTHDP